MSLHIHRGYVHTYTSTRTCTLHMIMIMVYIVIMIMMIKTIRQLAAIWSDHISARLFCPLPSEPHLIFVIRIPNFAPKNSNKKYQQIWYPKFCIKKLRKTPKKSGLIISLLYSPPPNCTLLYLLVVVNILKVLNNIFNWKIFCPPLLTLL